MGSVPHIGNKNYSSWSLRPWLVLRWAGIPFKERLIRLDQPGSGDHAIAEISSES
jgi:glutathione S-transferase